MTLSGQIELNRELDSWRALAAGPHYSAEQLTTNLRTLYDKVFSVDFSKIDVDRVAGDGQALSKALFDLKILLRDQIADWHAKQFVSEEAQTAIRDVFRVLRYAGDMFGELAIGHARPQEDDEPFKAFSGPHNNTLVNARFGDPQSLTFEAGDVILVRGSAHNSAAIARIGDIDSQFSHVGMVHVGDDGQRYCVEAIIEEGSIVHPLDHMLTHGNVRALLFRHKDRALAQRAAQSMYEHVKKSQDGTIPHIPYDFSMRLTGEEELFCSKLVRLAYLKGSEGSYDMPAFPTKLGLKNRDFIDRIGVMVDETFAPGDMELEPSFDLVAEWRDYRFTSKLRLQDMVMLKLLEWMELHKYKFEEAFPVGLISVLGRLSTYLSRSAKELLADVLPKVPSNMKRLTIAAVVMLHKTAEPILDKMLELEAKHIAKHRYQLHPRDVLDAVEEVRKEKGRRIGYLVKPFFSWM